MPSPIVEPTVRPLLPQDRDQLLALAPELTVGMPPWRSPEGVRVAARAWVESSVDQAGQPDHAVFVAVGHEASTAPADRVIGFVSVSERGHFSGGRDGYVGELVVATAARRSGVGRALMSAAEAWARNRGLDRISLETGAANSSALSFYAQLGYVAEEVTLTRGLA